MKNIPTPLCRALSLLLLFSPLSLAPGQQEEPSLDSQEQLAIHRAVTIASPSVVRIETIGGLEQIGQLLLGDGPTSGVVVSADGYILSSAFNFVRQPTSILVTTPSGKRAAAKIVARDRSRMLVLLKVNSEESFPLPQLASRKELQVGQWAIAIGRTLSRDSANISVGIISATNRIWGKAIQTDGKISPVNYGGALVDIEGRVTGILVPLSPQGQSSELAGTEWYDSGIGFAIPIVDLLPHLEKMKQGEDLHAGLLGVTLKGSDIYADPPEIAAVQPKSPASEATLKAGDRITRIDGMEIVRHAQLKHALGPHYAGDKIRIEILREGKSLSLEATLTDKLVPYELPFLGILPMRDGEPVTVRHLYKGGPAEAAGLQPGDRIVALHGEQLDSTEDLAIKISNLEIGGEVTLTVLQQGATKQIAVTLGRLPGEIPASLPPARGAAPAGDAPATGIFEIKLPEEKNECRGYLPENYLATVPHGLLVWIHEPGTDEFDKLVTIWKATCQRDNLILLAPRSADPEKWDPTEVDVVRAMIDEAIGSYNIDPTRIVIQGRRGGGAIGYLTAFNHRDIIRGIVPIDVAIPRRTNLKPNDPVERLSIYAITPTASKLKPAIQARLKQLEQMKYPVHKVESADAEGRLDAGGREQLARWIDSLDKI
ncbi:MAG: PDZ domain-containing protein [Pirellulaceae bacterium]